MLTLVDNYRAPTMADLVIQEFDQWSNPQDPTFAPTSICWYEHESETGH